MSHCKLGGQCLHLSGAFCLGDGSLDTASLVSWCLGVLLSCCLVVLLSCCLVVLWTAIEEQYSYSDVLEVINLEGPSLVVSSILPFFPLQ